MASQPHLVGRLALEVSVPDFDVGVALRPRLEVLAGERMPRIAEAVMETLDLDGVHLRLDRIDLDLGAIPVESLEQDALAALERALHESLAEALARARTAPSDDARLIPGPEARISRLAAYLRDGVLPFAARAGAPAPRAELLDLAREEPAALVATLRGLAGDRRALERLVLQAGDDAFAALLAILAPADAALILALIADVILAHREEPLRSRVRIAEPALERVMRVATLEFLLRDAGSQFNRRRFLSHLLHREAARAGLSYAELLGLLGEAVARSRRRAGFRSSLPVVLEALLAEEGAQAEAAAPDAAPEPLDLDAALAAARDGRFEALAMHVAQRAGDVAALTALVRRLDEWLFAGLIREIEPASAELILAILSDLKIVREPQAEPSRLSDDEFEVRMRVVTLRYLHQDPGTQFNRRRFLSRLLHAEAEVAGIGYADVVRRLSAAIERQRVRHGMRSSLPAVLAELIAEGGEPEPAPVVRDGLEEALTAWAAGDREPLVVLLTGGADWGQIERIVEAQDDEGFADVIARLRPGESAAILADLDSLIAARPDRLATERGYRRMLRAAALRTLLAQTGSFDRRRWLEAVIDTVARMSAWPERALRRDISKALGEDVVGADLDEQPSPSIAPEDREAVEASLRLLIALHARSPLVDLDADGFEQLLRRLADDHLAGLRGGRLDLRSFSRDVLARLARLAGADPAALAQALAMVAPPEARSWLDPFVQEHRRDAAGAAESETMVERYLLGARTAGAGEALVRMAAEAPGALARLIRRLARATPASAPLLIDRLLAWLLPEELLEVLSPGTIAVGRRHWNERFLAVLRGDPMPVEKSDVGFDLPALVAHWLDHGALPWWAPRGAMIEALAREAFALPLAELIALFATGDTRKTADRIARAAARLDPEARRRFYERIVPWAMGTTSPLAIRLATLEPARREAALAYAVAAALEGREVDLGALFDAEPAASEPEPAPAPEPERATDLARLLAWLDGAHAPPAEAEALARLFAQLADAGDPALTGYLRAQRGNRAARVRWAALLPPEGTARIVRLLLPPGAGAWIEAARVMAVAWRRSAGFGSGAGDPARVWALLLDAAAEPGATLIDAVDRIAEGLAGGDTAAAARLRAEALQLADGGGQVAVAAALRRATAAKAPKPRAPAKPVEKEAKVPPPEPDAEPDAEEPANALYIDNAGLVLLSPYLPMLFERLGILSDTDKGPRVQGVEAASRGVHLLQYCADGRLDAPEPSLALNKLLCGLSTGQPIEPSIECSDEDRALCDGLLGAVIGNWPMLSNSSVAALRETFLQREGRLLHGDDQWALTVQRKGLDVLVDQIPWSFSMIFHRWMPEAIQVTW